MSRRALSLAVALAVLAPAAPAAAHLRIDSTSPSKGSRVPAAIRAATVTFKGSPEAGSIRIFDRTGRQVSSGKGSLSGRRLRARLLGRPSRGRHVVRWRILAPDGDVQSGAFSFTVR